MYIKEQSVKMIIESDFHMRLTEEEIRIAQLFSAVTGIDPVLVVTAKAAHGYVAVVVVPCQMGGLAVGKDGTNVKWIAHLTKTASLIVVEECGDPVHMFKWFFRDNGANIALEGGVLKVKVPEHMLGKAVGRGGWKARLARMLAAELYGIKDVVIVGHITNATEAVGGGT